MKNIVFEKDCKNIISNTNLNKIKNSKILILGGNSFFASYIQAVLLMKNCEITSISLNNPKGIFKFLKKNKKINFIKLDLNNINRLQKILKKKYNYIFHCATYGQPQKWESNEYSTINLNTNVVKLILEHSKKFKSRVLFLSSASIYKISKSKKNLDEDSPLGIGKFVGERFYILSKILGEQLCKIYKEKYNLPIYVVRPGHTYGPGQDLSDPRVLPQFIKRAIIEKKIYMFDKGKTVRTWTYISDVIIMLLNIIQYGKSTCYNVCGKENISIFKIAKLVSSKFNNIPLEIKNKKLKFTNNKPSILKISSKKYFLEFKKIKLIKFSTGLERLILWNKLCIDKKK